jgi:hypothetical protein
MTKHESTNTPISPKRPMEVLTANGKFSIFSPLIEEGHLFASLYADASVNHSFIGYLSLGLRAAILTIFLRRPVHV